MTSDPSVAPTIAFRPLEADDFPTLVEWFAEPAVARWWNEPAELTSVESKYGPRIECREPTSMWIVEIERRPAGLLQCYRHVDHPEHDACVGIPDAVGIDYLIGNAHRGRGLAARVLRAFAAHALDQHPATAVCIATPAQIGRAQDLCGSDPGTDPRDRCHKVPTHLLRQHSWHGSA